MAFWKKKSKQTFREGVAEFWDWFPTVAERFGTLLDNQDGEKVVAEVSRKMEKTLPTLSWVFGGEGKGHSFTLTGEGQVARQLLAEYWLSQAVDVPGWEFFGSRQPSSPDSLASMAIRLSDQDQVDAETFLIRTKVDEEAEVVDIVAWHPAFESLPEEHHANILFIFLDEAMGEFGTQTWIGDIQIEPVTAGNDTRSFADFPKFLDSIQKYHGWEKMSPLECYTGYETQQQSDAPRGDTI